MGLQADHDSNGCSATRKRNISSIFIHVGPHKSGTTTIQDFFACHSDFLQEQNVYFLGKVNPRNVKGCRNVPEDFVRPMVQYKSSKGMKDLQTELKLHISLGHNVVLSDEDFTSAIHLVESLFRSFNRTIAYNVVPVVAYRRYHEWILSLYKFRNKPLKWDRGWLKWHKHVNVPTFRSFWQCRQNESHPSIVFLDTIRETLVRSLNITVCPLVLNMHKGSDLVTDFISEIALHPNISIPTANAANVDKGKPFAVDSEILAMKLKKKGRVHEKFARRKVVDMLQKKMESLYAAPNGTAPPLECPSPMEKQDLLSKSEESEKSLLSSEFVRSPMGQEALKRGYEQAIAKSLYCNIFLDEILPRRGLGIPSPVLERWRTLLKMRG